MEKKRTAGHFKRSWEYGLKLDPKSTNSSLQDVMYQWWVLNLLKTQVL